jgi:DNA-binding LacI/PurR family transcriptional regulator
MRYLIDPNNPLPRYHQVYQSLKKRIEKDEFPPDSALPPERQLVVDYGVSRITIVKALDTLEAEGLIRREHGRGTFVKQPQIETPVEQPRVIGFLPSGILHPFHYSVQLGIAEIAMAHHYLLQVLGLEDVSSSKIETMLNLLLEHVDGLITYPRPDQKDVKLYQRFMDMGIPFVMADRYYEGLDADYVGFQYEQAGYELTRLMLDRGHTRIAIMPHFEVDATSIRARFAGYQRAMREAGITDIDNMIWLDVYANYRPYSGQIGKPAMTQSLLDKIQEFKPTALIGGSEGVIQRLAFDLMAINAERAKVAIAQNGSTNYELDIEMASFAVQPPEHYGPNVVAVAYQPGELIGQEAARMLISRLHGEYQGPPRSGEIPVEIMIRD